MKFRCSSDFSWTQRRIFGILATLLVMHLTVISSLSSAIGRDEGLREFLKRRQMERKANFALGQKSAGAFQILGRGSTPVAEVFTSIGAQSVDLPFKFRPRPRPQLSRSKPASTELGKQSNSSGNANDSSNSSAVVQPEAVAVSESIPLEEKTSTGSKYRQRLSSKLSGFLKHKEEQRRLDSIAPTAGEIIRQRSEFIPGIRYRGSRPNSGHSRSALTTTSTTTTTTTTSTTTEKTTTPTTTTTTTAPTSPEEEATTPAELKPAESAYSASTTAILEPTLTTVIPMETENVVDELTTTLKTLLEGKMKQKLAEGQQSKTLINYPLEVAVPEVPAAVTRRPLEPTTLPLTAAVKEDAITTDTVDNEVTETPTPTEDLPMDSTGEEHPDLGLASSELSPAVSREGYGRAFADFVSLEGFQSDLAQGSNRRFTSGLVDDNPYLPKLIYLGDRSRLEKENDVEAQLSIEGGNLDFSNDYPDFGDDFSVSRSEFLEPVEVVDPMPLQPSSRAEKSRAIKKEKKEKADPVLTRSLATSSRIDKPVDEVDTLRPVFKGFTNQPNAENSHQPSKNLPNPEPTTVPVVIVKSATDEVFTVIATSASTPSSTATPSDLSEALKKLAKVRVGPSVNPGTRSGGNDAFLLMVNSKKNPKSSSSVSLIRTKDSSGENRSFSLSVGPIVTHQVKNEDSLAVNEASHGLLVKVGGYSKVVIQ